jgi:peptide/nickel transport system permease protein
LRLIGSLALTFLGLTVITFCLSRVLPIDPVLAVVGDRAPMDVYNRVFKEMGLDRPLYEQYWREKQRPFGRGGCCVDSGFG